MSKVLHRKRPRLVPLVDRHILDWYRPVTGEQSAGPAWRPLLGAVRADLQSAETRQVLESWQAALRPELGRDLSLLRMTNIVLWTAGQWGHKQPAASERGGARTGRHG